MTVPSLVFSILAASTYGSIFHLWKDGGPGYILLYILLSNIGFMGGHYLAFWRNWRFLAIGPVNFGAATLGSLLLLVIGHWLSRVNVE